MSGGPLCWWAVQAVGVSQAICVAHSRIYYSSCLSGKKSSTQRTLGAGGADGPHFVEQEGCETGGCLLLVYASLPTLCGPKHTVQTFVPLA